MDFGLASIVSEQGVTQTGTVMGTLSYMSPEQARGEALDARSDFFSLGATFYEMLAGRPAFQGETPAATLHAILTEEPPPIVGLPGALARVLTKCLRKQPQYRFANAAEISAGLGATEARAEPTGTAILPGRPVAPAPAATVAPDVAASLTSPPPAFRCSQCREPMSRTAAVCWRCGAPNSLISMRTQQAKRQQEVDNILHGLAPPSDRGGRGRKRR
jgi:serine/threonine-protein kinase